MRDDVAIALGTSDPVILSIVALIGTLATLVVGLINSWSQRRADAKLDAIKKQTDGITSALVETEKRASTAEGQLKGAKEERTQGEQAIRIGKLEAATPQARKRSRTKRKASP